MAAGETNIGKPTLLPKIVVEESQSLQSIKMRGLRRIDRYASLFKRFETRSSAAEK